jgi:hypothetical protein
VRANRPPINRPDEFGQEKEKTVKTWNLSLLATALLLASSAFAANNASIRVQEPVNVSGKQLATGTYKVSWEGNGPAVELSILKGKEVIAKVPAKIVNLPGASAFDALVTRGSGNTRELSQIHMGGKKYALEIAEPTNQAEAGPMK